MSTLTVSENVHPEYNQFKWQVMGLSLPLITLGLIVVLATGLRFYNLEAIGDGNLYYTAAIESMLQSPSNFFFVAAEPGGSVSIDKPPLGLWLQAISAMIFGVNGFAVALPQLLGGIFSIPLLYHLVRRYFGTAAGLIAAFVLAVTPVSIAAERNNTMDATLIFTLLLAAWAFIEATDSGKLRWLLIGAALVGLGFNIKMLQAFLPLPAFYALYIFGAKDGWRRKIGYLALTTIVLLVVSLSWVIAVDLTPADQRPYVGSSDTNSALELALGYNGVQRLLGGVVGGGSSSAARPAQDGQFTPGTAQAAPAMPNDGALPSDGNRGQAAGGIGQGEIGQAGLFRLFTQPLVNEVSWLLPFGLFTIILLVVASRLRLPLGIEHQAVVLWGGWLATEVVFFSAASFFHAYYLAMLAPPLAALVSIGVMQLWRMHDRRWMLSRLLLMVTGGITLLFQIGVVSQYMSSVWWIAPGILLAVTGAALLLWCSSRSRRIVMVGFACIVVAMLIVPAVWAGQTTLDENPNVALPHAYDGDQGQPGIDLGGDLSDVNSDLVAYLQAHTQGMKYLMAVPSSGQGARYVLETGRPVLYVGGFNGGDPVIDAEGLQQLVEDGELRYVLWGDRRGPGGNNKADVTTWLQSSCTIVTEISTRGNTLYQCGSS